MCRRVENGGRRAEAWTYRVMVHDDDDDDDF